MTLKEKIQDLINEYDMTHSRLLSESSDGNFYSLGIDEDGCPNSMGNYDDVYSDGFDNGTYQGEAEIIEKLKEILKYE